MKYWIINCFDLNALMRNIRQDYNNPPLILNKLMLGYRLHLTVASESKMVKKGVLKNCNLL